MFSLVVVAMVLAATGATAASNGSQHAATHLVSEQQTDPTASVATGSSTVVAAGTGTQSAAQTAATAAVAPQDASQAPVHTMSMDAPIQGGLTAHQEQAISARLRSAHQDVSSAPQSQYWTPALGRTAVARAESWLGMPYSWAGGDTAGPTAGRCVPGDGGDLDCHVIGFDCSGLSMYAWGPYMSLPHLAEAQRAAGAFHPAVNQLRPGDLVFFAGYLPGGTGHVAVYAGHGQVIEAPQSGSVIRRSNLADLMASDGAYRGATRPLTGATPTLTGARATVPSTGGLVTLHGTGLSNVNAVHLDGVTVSRFVRTSDSAITFRAPAHSVGAVDVAVSTPWRARSSSVTLSYQKPRSASPSTSPTKSTAPTAPPVTLAPSSTPPASSSAPPPSSAAPTPTPNPSSSSSSSSSSSTKKSTKSKSTSAPTSTPSSTPAG